MQERIDEIITKIFRTITALLSEKSTNLLTE